MANKEAPETLRMRAKDLSPIISRADFTAWEGKQADTILNKDPKVGKGTIVYGADNRNTIFKPSVTPRTAPGLNNDLSHVPPIVPRGTK